MTASHGAIKLIDVEQMTNICGGEMNSLIPVIPIPVWPPVWPEAPSYPPYQYAHDDGNHSATSVDA